MIKDPSRGREGKNVCGGKDQRLDFWWSWQTEARSKEIKRLSSSPKGLPMGKKHHLTNCGGR